MAKRLLAIFTVSMFAIGTLAFTTPANAAKCKSFDKMTMAIAHTNIAAAEEVTIYAVPKLAGFFKENCIEMDAIFANGSTASIQALLSKSADIAFASSVNVAQAVEQGLPVKIYSGFTITWPWKIGVLPDSKVQNMADLKGGSIGVSSMASVGVAHARVSIKEAGLKLSDVQIIPVGTGASATSALQTGRITALADFNDSWQVRENSGVRSRYLTPPSSVFDSMFSVSLVARTDQLASKVERDKLTRATRAMFMGQYYSANSPESAMFYGFREFPTLKLAGKSYSEQKRANALVLQSAFSSSAPDRAKYGPPVKWTAKAWQWGDLPTSRWTGAMKFIELAEYIKAPIPVNQIWDGTLIKGINQFDRNYVLRKPKHTS